MKKAYLWLALIALLAWPGFVRGEAVGQTAPEIELTCADGSFFSLREALREKELAAVCLFGSQCAPCQKELTAIQRAYEMYGDQVAVIGLSLDRTYDTDEVLQQFAQDLGLSFPLGRDPARTARFLKINTYPALMLVDQSGKVVHAETGAKDADYYAELFASYLGVSWTGREWDGDIEAGNNDVVSIGKETARVDSIPYDTLERAVRGAVDYDKALSPYYRLLSQTEWKFAYYENPAAFLASADAFFFRPGFDDSGWETIYVPSVWQTQGWDHPIYTNTTQKFARNYGNNEIGYPRDLPKAPEIYNPVGLYRHGFDVPEDWAGRRVFINLEGVDSAFYLWVNGIRAGYAEDSFTANEFDITDYVRFGGSNTLSVQVLRWCDGSWIEDQDMFDLSGIFRDVYIYAASQTRVRDYAIVTDFDETFTDAVLNVDVFVKNDSKEPAAAAVSLHLMDAEGREAALEGETALSALLQPGEEKTLSFSVPVPAPHKWSAEDPYLYTLALEEKTGEGTVYEAYRVGFRKITYKITESGWWEGAPTDHDLIRINGQPIMFRGVDRHETHPELGYALTKEVMEEDIRIMLENNINAVRTSHYPNNPYWYYLCDTYGVYVVDEANIECHSNMTAENQRLTDYLSRAIIDREYSMVRRDRNHACVVMWSLGNENKNPEILRTILVQSYPDPEGVERVLHEYTKDRPWHYEQARDMYETGIDVRSGMYALPDELIEHGQADGAVPMIECEYEHAMGNSEGNFDEYWAAFDTYRNLQGGFIWDFIDQSIYLVNENGEKYFGYGGDYGERVHDGNFCANGLLLPDRTVQPEMAEVKYHYQQIKFLDADADHGLITVKNFHLFTDIADKYEMRWTLKRNDTVLREGVVDESLLHIPAVDSLTGQPGEAEIRLPFELTADDLRAGCEYLLNIAVVLKEDTGMLRAGHTMAMEQFEITPDAEAPRAEPTELIPVVVIRENGQTRVSGYRDVLFDDATARITRITVDGVELIADGRGPAANFFRAGTDNDRGFGYGLFVFARPWKEAGDYQATRFDVDQSRPDRAVITAEGTYPGLNDTAVRVTYTVFYDGTVVCDYVIVPHYDKTYVYIPVVGMEMTVPGEFEQMTFFGRGPEENYWDRSGGTKVGVYETTVTENFVGYVRSGETGNRTGVRWVALRDENGYGLLAAAGDQPMEMSALHYTAQELDRGVHPYELNRLDDIILRLNAVQIGVGGDNSWSRIVPHAQYLPHEPEYRYSFLLSPLTPEDDAMEKSVELRSLCE